MTSRTFFASLLAGSAVSLLSAGRASAQFVTEYDVPTASSGVDALAPGPDGNIWFTEPDANKIGRITPAGVVTEFSIPTPARRAPTTRLFRKSLRIVLSPSTAIGRTARFT